MSRYLFAVLLSLFAFTTGHAQEQDGLLPVDQAYVLKAELAGPDRIALHWTIAKDYYLYKGRIKAKTSQPGLTLGTLDLPKGIEEHDEFFGDVEIYHDSVEASLPFTLADASAPTVDVTITVQGCHETEPKICYPPHPVKLSLKREAIAAAPAASPLAEKLSGGFAFGSTVDTLDSDEALPPEQAFVFEAIEMSPTEILARWTMPKGYYLYRDRSQVSVVDGRDVEVGAPQWPAGVDHTDEHFGTVVVYYNQVELPVSVRRADGEAQTIQLQGEFQGCKENGICYPVMQRTVAVDLDPASAEELAAAAKAFVPATKSIFDSTAADASAENALRSTPPVVSGVGVLGALLFAFLGGIILNLMPCVLPVLSFKVIGLAQSGESLAKARSHAIWYTLGVLVSFAVLGLLVIALRAAGQALGWGFQLQQPGFVAILIYVLLAVGLSLSGVFTIGASLAGTGQGLASKSGPAGDFFTGVLACIVASPCTAPFMGPALVFAFASSSIVALLIFLALGLGLALPFLLVGFIPALASRLPKPGAWMETFKQVLAFPMYLTAVWLVWVLGKQRGVDAIGLVLVGAVVLALALWWIERSRRADKPIARVLAVIVLIASLVPVWMIARLDLPPKSLDMAESSIAYSKDKLAALRADGRTVFVNMTADWCVTCKANEKSVLGTDHFEELMKQSNAIYMKGDWTNVDPEITAFLQAHGAVGVPLYVVFHGDQGNGKVLPTVLTEAIVEDALSPGTL
ncbi:MAG TPA: protein-disulfide reductase DsbD [Dokdonella sp.]|uniref:protein-disulfide reductase DsbD family protein n=1 Tax=Dokdonella sp. TaxID=2291710 RepID=UPI002D7F32EB|nr:protein-disulfide reductase DsbD [Dokdonella sp.]HET9032125.1 protein-disulfide reductase DsbD [Dokdonella sp.]